MNTLRQYLANLSLLLASTLFSLLVLEAGVRILDLWPRERAVTRAEAPVYLEQDASEEEAGGEAPVTQVTIHPFLGWGGRPRPGAAGAEPSPLRVAEGESEEWERLNRRRNVFGHHSAVEDPRMLRGEDFVLGVFGGSVALSLALQGGDAIVRRLEERRPELEGSIYLVNMAKGGYKQPQQLFLFQQMLLLGVPFDLVVNLDGFNEVAVSAADAMEGYHPLYPQSTKMAATMALSDGSPSAQEIELTAEILRLKRHTTGLEDDLKESPLGISELARALQGRRILQAKAQMVALEQALRETSAETRASIRAELPDPCLGQGFDCLPLITGIWKRSSLAMGATARKFGVDYLHILQPNQYVEGSKPLSEEERKLYFNPRRRWSRAVVLGYPVLQEHGKALRKRGVNFRDLTPLFAEHQETLYNDACCHLNRRGNQIMGSAVADLVADLLDRKERRRKK